ncbi:MAG: NUDIX domain-containing protein [Flavipsychrobacter sp.]
MINQDIKVAADSVIFAYVEATLSILLIQRKNDPFKGMWALPGGFVENDEDLEPAAIRELKEETGVELKTMQQLRAYGKPGRDPRFRTVSIVFQAIINPDDHKIAAADDAAGLQWFNTKELPEMAFDHREVVDYAIAHFSVSLNS